MLVRHAAPIVEPDVAPKRWRLSEGGRDRCVLLAEMLRFYGPEVVVASEEPKAVETARIVADRLGLESPVCPGLHEHDRTGAPFLDNDGFYRTAKSFFENPANPLWGNETADQAGERFEKAVRSVLEEREEEVLAIVAHGTVISLLISRHNEVDAYDFWRALNLPSFCILSAPSFHLRETVPDLEA